jgi:hypothetical protein
MNEKDRPHFFSNDHGCHNNNTLDTRLQENMEALTSLPKYSDDTEAHPPPLKLEDDTQEAVGFLLALKHRSVTPEPETESEDSEQPEKRHDASVAATRLSVPKNPHDLNLTIQHPSHMPILPNGFVGEGQAHDEKRDPTSLEELTEMDLDNMIRDSMLVQQQDRGLVPDALLIAMAQMKPCHLTHADRVGCYKTRDIGFVGICCKHCGGHPGFGKYFPGTVRSLAQTTTSQTMIKHVGNKCRFCPQNVRQTVNELQRNQESTGRPRYGARKTFFERIWTRLHNQTFCGESETESSTQDEREEEEEEEERLCLGHLSTKKRRTIEQNTSKKRSRVSYEISN